MADPRNFISHKKGELLKRFSFFVTIFIENNDTYEKTPGSFFIYLRSAFV